MKLRGNSIFPFKRKGFGHVACWVFFLGFFNLLFLPFIHFHPGQTHAHPGYELEHHHAGHFHSPELESLAGYVHTSAGGAETNDPTGHTHSSPAEESGKVEFPFVTPGGKSKVFTLTQVDVDLLSPAPMPVLSGRTVYLIEHSPLFDTTLNSVPPVRGPPIV